MKTQKLILFIIFIAILPILTTAETWKITSLDWPPYAGSDMANQGNSIQKLKALLKTEGIDLVVEFYPWERAQQLAKTKEYFGYFPAWPEEVDSGFIASKPVDNSNIGVLVNTDSSLAWKDIETLFQGNKIGLITSYVYPGEIEKLIEKYPTNVDYCQDEKQLMRKLAGKRFDAAITDPSVTLHLAKQEGIANIKILNPSIMAKDLVVACRVGDDNTARLELLNGLLKSK